MPKSNVYNFPTSHKSLVPVTPKMSVENAYDTYTLSEPVFGLCTGDLLICQTDFEEKAIRPQTICVVETKSGQIIAANVRDLSSVRAVVVAFVRDI